MSKPIYDYVLKFIIVGDSTVGKSNIMSSFTDKRFLSDHTMTIGVEFATKVISVENIKYKIQIWDTAGQETFKAITRSYYRGTLGCMLVYDITNKSSFDSLNMWLDELKKHSDPKIVIVLIGNKVDLDKERQVAYEEGKMFADQHNIAFFETSAKTFHNIDSCFVNIIQQINKKIEAKEIDIISCKIQNSTVALTRLQNTTSAGASNYCHC